MYYDLNEFEDPKLIDFFLSNLKSEPPTYFEEYGDQKVTRKFFYHSHGTVNLLKPPGRGNEKNVSRNGIPKMHIFGNAVSIPKHIHASYCDPIHPKHYEKDGTIKHPLEENILVKLNKIRTIFKKQNIQFYQGQKVIARWDIFGVYFSGSIEDIINIKFADVKLDSKHRLFDVPFSNIIAFKRRKIKIGDYVMANILNEFDKDCWVPGIVKNIDYKTEPISYHIVYYNGEEGLNIYIQLIKINKLLYQMSKDFILNLLLNKEKSEDYSKCLKFWLSSLRVVNAELNENAELFIFSREYFELKKKYNPLLQPSSSYNSVILPQTDKLISLRKSLPSLKNSEQVLAKWPDDCWYYPSTVKDYVGDYKYKIENNLRAVKLIFREDLIKMSNLSKELKVGDTVLAEHPKFRFAYAPGEIRRLDHRQHKYIVRFYDYSECLIEGKNLYKISKEKFEIDVDSIIKLERSWIGHDVLSYNHFTNKYEWGIIRRRVLNSRQFEIEWSDHRCSIHCAYFLFISKNKNYDDFFKKFIEFNKLNSVDSKWQSVDMENSDVYKTEITRLNNKNYNNLTRAESNFKIDKNRETPIIDAAVQEDLSYLD